MASRAAAAPAEHTRRRSPFGGRRLVVLVLVLVLLAMVLLRSLVLDVFYIPSGSMQPGLQPGDRVLVDKLDNGAPRRGEVVVFDGTGSLAQYRPGATWFTDAMAVAGSWIGISSRNDVFVKRVVGIGGDTVKCCSASGKLLVNGQETEETYLMPGDRASDAEFTVTVPAGRMWVMGDHRSDSRDSRALLGAPGGGMIPTDTIIGRPVRIIWPLDRAGALTGDAGDAH